MQKNKRDPWVLAGMGIVAVVAIVASFTTLTRLALWVGWDHRTGWLLPLCLDVLAMAAGRVWLSEFATTQARRYARTVSMTALGVSVVGNAIGHIVGMTHAGPVRIMLAIVVGSIPPVALAAVGHLATLATLQVAEPAPVVEEVPVAVAELAAPEPPAKPKQRRGTRPAVKKTEGRAFWDSERAAGRTPSGAAVAREAQADPTSGANWVREWLAEEEAVRAANAAPVSSFTLVTA